METLSRPEKAKFVKLNSYLRLLEEVFVLKLPSEEDMDRLIWVTYCAHRVVLFYSTPDWRNDMPVNDDEIKQVSKHSYSISTLTHDLELIWVIKYIGEMLSRCVAEDGTEFLPIQDKTTWISVYKQVVELAAMRLSQENDFDWDRIKI